MNCGYYKIIFKLALSGGRNLFAVVGQLLICPHITDNFVIRIFWFISCKKTNWFCFTFSASKVNSSRFPSELNYVATGKNREWKLPWFLNFFHRSVYNIEGHRDHHTVLAWNALTFPRCCGEPWTKELWLHWESCFPRSRGLFLEV